MNDLQQSELATMGNILKDVVRELAELRKPPALEPAFPDLPEQETYTHKDLLRRYVVLHSGVGSTEKGAAWLRGAVVDGYRFFSMDNLVHRTMRKVTNRLTGQFELVVVDQRRMNEEECLASLHRLLALKAIRRATEEEAKFDNLELEKPKSTALVGSNEEKLAQLQAELEEQKQLVAKLLQNNMEAKAITEARNVKTAAPVLEDLPEAARPQPVPGGRAAPRQGRMAHANA